jgi:hypothetical protein
MEGKILPKNASVASIKAARAVMGPEKLSVIYAGSIAILLLKGNASVKKTTVKFQPKMNAYSVMTQNDCSVEVKAIHAKSASHPICHIMESEQHALSSARGVRMATYCSTLIDRSVLPTPTT